MNLESRSGRISEQLPASTRDQALGRGQGRLTGKVVLVVGGGTVGAVNGTGSAMSILFAAQGAKVAVLGRTSANTTRTVTTITNAGDKAIAVLADASEEEDCVRAVEETIDHFGQLDILVNNLGTTIGPKLASFDQASWDVAMKTNVTSILFMSKYALPHLANQGASSIINISSIAGMQSGVGDTEFGGIAYETTKATIIALTRSLANELGPHGIRVNCVVPGHLATPAAGTANDFSELRKELTMLRIEGTGWDVAWAALFFASDDSRYVTSVSLPVDGGVTQKQAFTNFLRLRAIGL